MLAWCWQVACDKNKRQMNEQKTESDTFPKSVCTQSNQSGTGEGTDFARANFTLAAPDTYSLIASGLRVGIAEYGDITGNLGNKQHVRKARAPGIGKDDDTKRAEWLDNWLQGTDGGDTAARTAIHASITADNEQGNRLWTIATTAAKRQAQRIGELRGVNAGDTSKDDAAQDAVVAMLQHVRRLDKLTAAQWETARVRRVLALYASRAAFLSLANWASVGMTGDNTTCSRFDKSFVTELTTDLAQRIAAESVQPSQYDLSDTRARRSVVRWVFGIGLNQFAADLPQDMRANARARAIQCARQRCRAIGSIVFGATMDDAIFHAGFSSLKSFAESCKDASLFESLRKARAASIADCQAVELARIAMVRYSAIVKDTWHKLQALPSGTDFDGATRNAHLFKLQGKLLVVKDTTRAKQSSLHLARVHLAQRYNHALRLACHYRDIAKRATNDTLAMFDKVFARRFSDATQASKAQFDTLGHVTGLRDALGRATNASKQDGATIRAARGKVSHKRRDTGTVSLKVGRRSRGLPCAPLAPAAACDAGTRIAAMLSPMPA